MSDRSLLERLEEFMKTFKDIEGSLLYWLKIQQMSINDEISITINCQHLLEFDNHFLQYDISSEEFVEALDHALIGVLRIEDPDFINSIDVSLLRARIIKHPNELTPSHLKSHLIGKLMTVKGVIVDASKVTPLLKQAMFLCRICQTEIPQPQEHGVYTEPALCPVCTKKTSMRLVDSKSQFVDFQSCKIQDVESTSLRVPTTLDARLETDIAGLAKQGDVVSFTGVLRSSPRKEQLATYDFYLDVVGFEKHEHESQHGKERPSINLEEDLEDLLQRNPDLLGHEYRVLERQKATETGRIDLLCEAPDTAIVVVELKVEKADRNVVGQILEYLAWAEQKYGPQRKVRGIIVANGFTDRMVTSLRGSKYHIRLVDLASIIRTGGGDSESD